MAPSSAGRGSLAAHSPPLAAVSTSIHVQPPRTAANSPRAAKNRTLPASPGSACVRSFSRSPLDHHLQPLLLLLSPHLHQHHFGLHLRRLHPALAALSLHTASAAPQSILQQCPRSPSTLRTSRTCCSTCTASWRTSSAARPTGRATPPRCAAGPEREGREGVIRAVLAVEPGLPPLTDAPPLPPPCSAVSKSTYLYRLTDRLRPLGRRTPCRSRSTPSSPGTTAARSRRCAARSCSCPCASSRAVPVERGRHVRATLSGRRREQLPPELNPRCRCPLSRPGEIMEA